MRRSALCEHLNFAHNFNTTRPGELTPQYSIPCHQTPTPRNIWSYTEMCATLFNLVRELFPFTCKLLLKVKINNVFLLRSSSSSSFSFKKICSYFETIADPELHTICHHSLPLIQNMTLTVHTVSRRIFSSKCVN